MRLDIFWDLPYVSTLHTDLACELCICLSMTLHYVTLHHAFLHYVIQLHAKLYHIVLQVTLSASCYDDHFRC